MNGLPIELWSLSRIFEALESGCAVMIQTGPPMETELLRTSKDAVDFLARNAMRGHHEYQYPCILIPQETTRVVMVVRMPGNVDVQKLLFSAIESKHGEIIEWGSGE